MKDIVEIFRNFYVWLQYVFTPVNLVIILLFVVLILTGCSGQQSGIKVVKQEVEVPIMMKCISIKDVPKYNEYVTIKINKTDSDYVKVKKLIIRDYEHQKYAKVVDVLLKKCSQD